MKVKSIELKNFSNFREISVNLNDDVTYLVGGNGAGKSTLGCTAIWFILKGIAERGDVMKGKRFRFIGTESGIAEGTLVLADEKGEYRVTRRIAEDAQWLEISSDTGVRLDQEWLNSFWNEMLISPMTFARLNPKEQARHLGIDVSEFESETGELKLKFTEINSVYRSIGEVEIPEEVQKIEVSGLLEAKKEILAHNERQKGLERERADLQKSIATCEAENERLLRLLEENGQKAISFIATLEALPEPEIERDSEWIDFQIQTASETNTKFARREDALAKQAKKEELAGKLEGNKQAQKAVESRKIEYLQSLDLPFSNLTIDENGGLLMDARPIQEPYFSTGELLKIIPILLASRNPEWKYVFLQYFDLLDEKKAKEVIDYLTGEGFQLVIEKVGKMEGENVIVLKDLK